MRCIKFHNHFSADTCPEHTRSTPFVNEWNLIKNGGNTNSVFI